MVQPDVEPAQRGQGSVRPLKAMTPELHRRLTGMDNQPVHNFARRLAKARRPIWVRFVLVPGWTEIRVEEVRVWRGDDGGPGEEPPPASAGKKKGTGPRGLKGAIDRE